MSVLVVGAGPAGLATVVELAEAGVAVTLVDAAAQPGGQYWRHPDEATAPPPSARHGWSDYVGLRARLDRQRAEGRIDYRTGQEVWLAWPDDLGGFELRTRPTVTATGSPATLRVDQVVVCTGGHDRQLPIPGWDLPGVMTAGGVQSLLKGQQTLAGRQVVVAGTGPFLLPVASGLADAGARVLAVCEANAVTGWLRSASAVAGTPTKITEGMAYAAALRRHRIAYRTRTIVGEIRAEPGQEATGVTSVRLDRIDRTGRVTAVGVAEHHVDLVALGWGFVPSTDLVTMLGAQTRRDVDGSLVAVVDAGQRSTTAGVYVAGEACGVGGAVLSVAEGRLAAYAVRADLEQRPSRLPAGLRSTVRRHRAFAVAMHRAHPVPRDWPDWCRDDTLVCRCEEVTLAEVRHATDDLAATDPRSIRSFTRCGMGWCQGRICGSAVADLAAHAAGREVSADDLRGFARRTLAVPVRLDELAAMHASSKRE